MKGFAGVLLAAVIPFLKREKRAEAKNKQDPSAISTGGQRGVDGMNGRDFKAAIHQATSLLYCFTE